jgi:hypothetical protein
MKGEKTMETSRKLFSFNNHVNEIFSRPQFLELMGVIDEFHSKGKGFDFAVVNPTIDMTCGRITRISFLTMKHLHVVEPTVAPPPTDPTPPPTDPPPEGTSFFTWNRMIRFHEGHAEGATPPVGQNEIPYIPPVGAPVIFETGSSHHWHEYIFENATYEQIYKTLGFDTYVPPVV